MAHRRAQSRVAEEFAARLRGAALSCAVIPLLICSDDDWTPRRTRFGVIDRRILWAEGDALGFLRSILVGISAAARLCGGHWPYACALRVRS
jgi:hypothetical protein